MNPLNSFQALGKIGDYVYQRVAPGLGNVPDDPTGTLQKRKWVKPTAPPTAAQTARRIRMRAAVAEWQSLSPPEKLTWKPAGDKRRITGFNAFISNRMLRVMPAGLGNWDNNATIWDGNNTIWLPGNPTTWDAGATTFDNGSTFFID